MIRTITVKNNHLTNLEQYVAIFPKGTGTGPVPKRVRKIPASQLFCQQESWRDQFLHNLQQSWVLVVAESWKSWLEPNYRSQWRLPLALHPEMWYGLKDRCKLRFLTAMEIATVTSWERQFLMSKICRWSYSLDWQDMKLGEESALIL